jgi:hypothetical protein
MLGDPTPGNSKAIAAVLAGAVTTVLVWGIHQFGGIAIPDYVQGSITTIISTAAVYFVPHQVSP